MLPHHLRGRSRTSPARALEDDLHEDSSSRRSVRSSAPAARTIQKICADTGAKVDIDDDGNVFIAAVDPAAGYAAKKMIDDICFVPEVGACIMEGCPHPADRRVR